MQYLRNNIVTQLYTWYTRWYPVINFCSVTNTISNRVHHALKTEKVIHGDTCITDPIKFNPYPANTKVISLCHQYRARPAYSLTRLYTVG